MKCKIVNKNGINAISMPDGKVLPAAAFKTFRACDKNISDFYRAGVRIFCVLDSGIKNSLGTPYSLFGDSWTGDYEYDFDVIDRQLDLFIKNAPDGYFALMLSIDTREWWHKERKAYPSSFYKLSQMEGDSEWREKAGKYLQSAIRHVEEKYGEKIFSYFILCGGTTEWFSEKSYEEPSEHLLKAFKAMYKDKAEIPSKQARDCQSSVFIQGEEREKLIRYRKFEAYMRSDTLLYFAKIAKEASRFKKLVGAYYGYIFELDAPRLWNTCALDYERVFNSPYIDIIANPISYQYRSQTDLSAGMVADASINMKSKLCFYEHDQTTSIVPDIIEGTKFVHPNKVKTIEEDINLLRRDFLLCASRGCAVWWFDMFGGWFYHDRFMAEIKNMVSITNILFEKGYKSSGEVAFIADAESLYFVNKNSHINEMLLMRQREGLSRMGAPYDLYTFGDMEDIDFSPYKLIIFADSFYIDEKKRKAINLLKKQGKSLLFLYGAGNLSQDGEPCIQKMNALLGMKILENGCDEDCIKLNDGTESRTHMKFPCYHILQDGKVNVLGVYGESGRAAFGYVKNEGGGIVAFSGLGALCGEALCKLCEICGVHVYGRDKRSALYVSKDLLGVYHLSCSDAIIYLKPEQDGIWTDLFENKNYISQNGVLRVPYNKVRAKLLIKK